MLLAIGYWLLAIVAIANFGFAGPPSWIAKDTVFSGPDSDTRLRANTWSTSADGTEGCSSPVRDISAGSTSGNTIRFVAQGADHIPEHLSLIIDIASPSLTDDAKREMIKATKRLSVRALGLSIPHKIDESILKGENVQLEVGSGVVTITRTNRAQGAYQLTLTMR
ncbi:MAG: hypothetical protein Q7T27_12005 [Pseudomonas sp.]|uniref:hypothetical protein n=1 Tax=Pseudomonas sp. TaxID=306 RepID=UPI0027163AD2|nr:hypothetical protein [Pseudomonas sp.]MDO8404203.1 hypothetical protein [Pseudomonas sp.]